MLQELIASFDLSAAQQLLDRGGPVVLIIAVLSVAAVAVALAKFAQFIYCGIGRGRGVEAAMAHWVAGRPDQAIDTASGCAGAAAFVLAHVMRGLSRGAPQDVAREDAERLANRQLARLRRHFRVLEATAQIAPLLGLFGTVLGMMSAFQTLQAAGADADPAALAGGIWVALTTTAVGLAVAIPAGLALYWFEGRLERETGIMESALSEVFTGPVLAQNGGRADASTGVSSAAC